MDDTPIKSGNDFCRVFKLPDAFAQGFVHGGRPTPFVECDWFNPVPPPAVFGQDEYTVQELRELLFDFLRQKNYVTPNGVYLVVADYGDRSDTFTFSAEGINPSGFLR